MGVCIAIESAARLAGGGGLGQVLSLKFDLEVREVMVCRRKFRRDYSPDDGLDLMSEPEIADAVRWYEEDLGEAAANVAWRAAVANIRRRAVVNAAATSWAGI